MCCSGPLVTALESERIIERGPVTVQKERLAKTLGQLLNPFAVFTILFASAAVATTGSWLRGGLYLMLELVAAAFVIGYLKDRTRAKKASDFWLQVRQERFVPSVVLLVTALGLQVSLIAFEAPPQLLALMGSILAAALVMALLTIVWKASAHAAVVAHSALWGTATLGLWGLPFVVALPIVLWARVTERRHTTAEALGGAVVGTLVATVALALL